MSFKQVLKRLKSRLPSEETAGWFTLVLTLLFTWVLLFAIGVTIDSEPYREAVSPEGAAALERMDGSGTAPVLPDTLESLLTRLENTASGSQDSLSVVRRGDTLQIVEGSPGSNSDSGPPSTSSSSTGSPSSGESSGTTGQEDTLGSGGARSGGASDSPSTDTSTEGRSAADGSSVSGDAGQEPVDAWSFFMVLICFTPTNLAFLSCTAGVLGAIGRSLKLVNGGDRPPSDETYPLLSAVIRGLFVFLVVISGLLALLENPILDTASPGQYIRYAGLISLTSFVVNYDPNVFAMLLDQVRERMEEGSGRSPSESGEENGESSGASRSQ